MYLTMEHEASFLYEGRVRKENISFYNEAGYLIAPDLLSKEEIDELRQETSAIFRGDRGHHRRSSAR